MKLHLGCGEDYLEGYINCDFDETIRKNMFLDLEKPLPLEDNSVSHIYTKNTFEHIKNIIPLMKELHRVCKNGSIINIRVPFYSSYAFLGPLDHYTRFSPMSFNKYIFKEMFKVNFKIKFFIEEKGIFLNLINKCVNFISNKYPYFYCRALANILPSSEIEYFLEVVK